MTKLDLPPEVSAESESLSALWSPLGDAARSVEDADESHLLNLLASVASFHPQPDNWLTPYGPAIALIGQRTPIPADLSPDEIAALAAVADLVPHARLRARIYDVLSLSAGGAMRVDYSTRSIEALMSQAPRHGTWFGEHEAWERAIVVCRRYGQPLETVLAALTGQLLQVVYESDQGYFPLQAASLLRRHGLARGAAAEVGNHLVEIANASEGSSDQERAYRDEASAWLSWNGDFEGSHDQSLLIMKSLSMEGDLAATTPSEGPMRAANLFERALKRLRNVPRSVRDAHGLAGYETYLAQRIRVVGQQATEAMHSFESEAVDLTEVAHEIIGRITGLEPLPALVEFARLAPFASIDSEQKRAKETLAEHPMLGIFGTVHYASDGRVVHKSAGLGTGTTYGVDTQEWRQIMQGYTFRIQTLVTGLIVPGYRVLANEHRLAFADFEVIVRDCTLVPSDHVRQFARALHHGYNGDFASAAQLLAPQMESLVRHHFAAAGEVTSVIGADGTEDEVGLSALVEREVTESIFGRDLAFEFRALLCDPLGPNLRNEVAHGLLDDNVASGAAAVYLWWFGFKLVFLPYWSRLRAAAPADTETPLADPGAETE